MIRKFARISAFGVAQAAVLMTILAGVATVHAQQTESQPPDAPQTQQEPASQQPPQEASPEEMAHKKKPKDYKNWAFNVGGGGSLTSGTTKTYVRSGGPIAAAGVARNYSKYFGFRLDFQFDDLPLRASALELAQAPGGNDHVYSLTLDPIINIPVTKDWGAYIVGGPAFFHRSGKLESSTATPGYPCNGFFTWWGHCYAAALPINGNFLHSSQNEFGENFGIGITRKIRPDIDFYAEIRIFHGSYNNITTDLRPITIGVRW
jgi:hypothetical protein